MKRYNKKWNCEYRGHQIEVSNWWSFNFQSEACLIVNDQIADSSNKAITNPKKPLLRAFDINEEIKSIEVFICALVTIKVSIHVNDEIIFADKLNLLEKLYAAIS